MVKLELNIDGQPKTYDIPEGWNEVSVGRFEDIASVDKEQENEFQMSLDVIRAVVGISEDDLNLLPLESVPEILETMEFVKQEIDLSPSDEIVTSMGTFYLKDNFDKLTVGEVISVETLTKKYNGNFEKGIAEMLCIFLRQKKEDGTLEAFKNSFMERSEVFRNEVMIEDVYQLFVFFSNGRNS